MSFCIQIIKISKRATNFFDVTSRRVLLLCIFFEEAIDIVPLGGGSDALVVACLCWLFSVAPWCLTTKHLQMLQPRCVMYHVTRMQMQMDTDVSRDQVSVRQAVGSKASSS